MQTQARIEEITVEPNEPFVLAFQDEVLEMKKAANGRTYKLVVLRRGV